MMADTTRLGSLIGASWTTVTPSGKSSATIAAALNARRVFPTPPGLVRVSSGTSSRSNRARTSANSRFRPMSGVRGSSTWLRLLDDSGAVTAALPEYWCAMKMIAPLQQRPAQAFSELRLLPAHVDIDLSFTWSHPRRIETCMSRRDSDNGPGAPAPRHALLLGS